jgi:Zn-dependent protease with chaperone function
MLCLATTVVGGCATTRTAAPTLDRSAIEVETAKQREIALGAVLDDYQRLFNVGFPLLFAAEEFCTENRSARIGWLISSQWDFPEAMRSAAAALYKTGDFYRVMHVVQDSPAAIAGIRSGDKLLSWAGNSLPKGSGSAGQMHKLRKRLLQQPAEQIVRVERDGQELSLAVSNRWACDSRLLPYTRDEVNAFADGEFVAVSRGMMRFAQQNDQLAFVVAHEIAHNAMGHIKAKTNNGLLGFLFDFFALFHGIQTGGAGTVAAVNAFSPEFEHEADYIGLYIIANAGLSLDNAANFWRRMAAIHPGSIDHVPGDTHPSAPQRFLAIEAAVKEIKRKQDAGLELSPEWK